MRRVLIIGLDGATLDLILPWVDQGKLPNFAKILSGGSYGELNSTFPPMTFPAWTSFMTGKNPGKHGIFDFTEREPGGYGIRFVNANWRKSRTIWQILSDASKRVAVISVPGTYPPESVNGLMISGFDAPGMSGGQADAQAMYPASLHQELLDNVGGCVISSNAEALLGTPAKALRAILDTIDQKTRCAKYLYRKEPWDVFMILLGETDLIGHHFWKYHDPKSPLHCAPPSLACRQAILAVYEKADAFIGDMLGQVWDSTTVVLVSDHGMGGCSDTGVHLNLWLAQEGFLHFHSRSARGTLNSIAGWPNQALSALVQGLKRLGVKMIPPEWKSWLLRRRPDIVNRIESYLRFNAIDWDETVAFAEENPYYPSIWINVKGREPQGRVGAGLQYETVRDTLTQRLYEWTDPETRQPVVNRVFKREELYKGSSVERAPDLLIDWRLKGEYSYVPRRSHRYNGAGPLRRLSHAEQRKISSGSHRKRGIVAFFGDGIRVNAVISGAEIIDIAPTLLYALGVPIPDDMDGKLLEDVIQADVLRTQPARYSGSEWSNEGGTEQGYSGEEVEVIEERLRTLGYLD